MTDEERITELRLRLQRVEDENRILRKWVVYLESSTASIAEGVAGGLRNWIEDLRKMSPLRNGPDQPAVDPE